MDDVVARMRADLTAATRARDRTTTAVLRSALAAVANAEAVPAPATGGSVGDGPVAGAVVGVGSTEAARRVLSADDVVAVLRAERDERMAAAGQLAAAGSVEAAAELRATAGLLAAYVR